MKKNVYHASWDKQVLPTLINFADHMDYRELLRLLDDLRNMWLYEQGYQACNPENGVFLTVHNLEEHLYKEAFPFERLYIKMESIWSGIRAAFHWHVYKHDQHQEIAYIAVHMVAVKRLNTGVLKPCSVFEIKLKEDDE